MPGRMPDSSAYSAATAALSPLAAAAAKTALAASISHRGSTAHTGCKRQPTIVATKSRQLRLKHVRIVFSEKSQTQTVRRNASSCRK
jgi:hypothetical protein